MAGHPERTLGPNARQHVAPIGNRLYRRLPTCGTADYQSALHLTSGSLVAHTFLKTRFVPMNLWWHPQSLRVANSVSETRFAARTE
jgi:hypothetical protein